MNFFGIVFIVSTTLLMILKKEENPNDQASLDERRLSEKTRSLDENLSVKETYGLMWQICWLKPIQTMILILMTVKVT
jgi:hypothetical protein